MCLRIGTEGESQELNPVFLCGWQESNYLNPHHSFPGSASTGSWKWQLNLCFSGRLSNTGYRELKNIRPNAYYSVVDQAFFLSKETKSSQAYPKHTYSIYRLHSHVGSFYFNLWLSKSICCSDLSSTGIQPL